MTDCTCTPFQTWITQKSYIFVSLLFGRFICIYFGIWILYEIWKLVVSEVINIESTGLHNEYKIKYYPLKPEETLTTFQQCFDYFLVHTSLIKLFPTSRLSLLVDCEYISRVTIKPVHFAMITHTWTMHKQTSNLCKWACYNHLELITCLIAQVQPIENYITDWTNSLQYQISIALLPKFLSLSGTVKGFLVKFIVYRRY